MNDKVKGKRLGDLTAYERWELPNIAADGSMSEARIEKAEPIKPLTADDIEAIRQEAYRDGFDQGKQEGFDKGVEDGLVQGKEQGFKSGYEEGYAQGIEASKHDVDTKLSTLSSLISQLPRPLGEHENSVKESLLNVVVALSRAVIHKELLSDKQIIKRALDKILSQLPDYDHGAALIVNPCDFPLVEETISQLGRSFELVSDDSVMVGGFELRTDKQLVNYTLEKRFQKSVQAMLNRSLSEGDDIMEYPSTMDELSDFSSHVLNSDDEATVENAQKNDSAPNGDSDAGGVDVKTEGNDE